jgi:hypothetical protein
MAQHEPLPAPGLAGGVLPRFRERAVLVTGGPGFIGSAL